MAGPTIEIAPPIRTARTGGIGEVATFRPNERLGAAQGLTFQSHGCTFPQESQHLCYVGEAAPADKTFGGIELEDAVGAPFPLYAGVACFLGPDPDELERSERLLEEGQDRALESALTTWATAGATIADGETLDEALANVEQAIDDQYLGQGVIMMSRGDALLADGVKLKDGQLITLNGTPVLASGRVPRGVVFGLGAIVVEHSTAITAEVTAPETNTQWALAEKIFALAVDCEFRVVSNVVVAP